jgi:hypothetical protein
MDGSSEIQKGLTILEFCPQSTLLGSFTWPLKRQENLGYCPFFQSSSWLGSLSIGDPKKPQPLGSSELGSSGNKL